MTILYGAETGIAVAWLVPAASTETAFARFAQAGTLAVNSIPNAFITAIVVFNVGLPCSLSDR
jgi:hypothetical protein